MPGPNSLPPHLSYKSSLVLIPPASIQEPIQALRRQHDKHFRRWPPHINVIYPFLSSPSEPPAPFPPSPPSTSPDRRPTPPPLRPALSSRLRSAAAAVAPFALALSAQPAGVFAHGERSATVWLRPLGGDGRAVEQHGVNGGGDGGGGDGLEVSRQLVALRAALQGEFAECDADARPFVPHLSVGQARGARDAESLGEKAGRVVREFVGRSEGGDGVEGQGNGAMLVWHVDRVFVIERKGFHDPFRVVESVELTGTDEAELASEVT